MDAFSFYIILNAFVSVKRFSPFFFSFFSIFKKDVPFPETRLPSPQAEGFLQRSRFPLRGSWLRQQTDEAASRPCHIFTAVMNASPPWPQSAHSRAKAQRSPSFNNAAAWRIGGRNDSRLASPEAAFPMFRSAPLEKTDHFPFFALRKNYKDFVNPLDFPEFSGRMMQEILPKLF